MNRDSTWGARGMRLWESGVCYDTTGVDSDIEQSIGLLQQRHGYTRAEANAELVRRLSFVACAHPST